MMIWRSSRFAILLASAAALSLTATPAMARHWHNRDRGIDGGDLLAGVLIIGGIAAVAAAASKSSRDSRAPEDRYPEDAEAGNGTPSDEDYRNWRNDRDRGAGYTEPGTGDYSADRSDDNYRGGRDWRGAGSTDVAIESCVDEIERDGRVVDTVDGINRESEGWRVDGRLRDGRPYACTADNEGSIRRLTVDGRGVI